MNTLTHSQIADTVAETEVTPTGSFAAPSSVVTRPSPRAQRPIQGGGRRHTNRPTARTHVARPAVARGRAARRGWGGAREEREEGRDPGGAPAPRAARATRRQPPVRARRPVCHVPEHFVQINLDGQLRRARKRRYWRRGAPAAREATGGNRQRGRHFSQSRHPPLDTRHATRVESSGRGVGVGSGSGGRFRALGSLCQCPSKFYKSSLSTL